MSSVATEDAIKERDQPSENSSHINRKTRIASAGSSPTPAPSTRKPMIHPKMRMALPYVGDEPDVAGACIAAPGICGASAGPLSTAFGSPNSSVARLRAAKNSAMIIDAVGTRRAAGGQKRENHKPISTAAMSAVEKAAW